jgi:hypothetical protein
MSWIKSAPAATARPRAALPADATGERAMRMLCLLLPMLLLPALPAQGEARLPRLAPGPGCSAPALWPAVAPPASAGEELPSPMRLAMLSCVGQAKGPRKRPIRWT